MKRSVALALTLLVVGCTGSQSQNRAYRQAFEGDVPSLDPIQVGDTQSHDVAYNLFNTLVSYRPLVDKPGQKLTDLVPDLAESWTVSPDQKTYTFKLREGVKFHNGRLLEAKDLKYSFERLANPKNASKGLWTAKALKIKGLQAFQDGKTSELGGVQAPDQQTLVVSLDEPVPFALHVLAMPYYAAVPKEEAERLGQDFTNQPVGTGPYKFQSYQKGQKLVLVKNPDYFESGLPYIEQLEYLIVPGDEQRLLRFEHGELEHVVPISAASFERVLADKKWNPMGPEAIREVDAVNDPVRSFIIKSPRLVTSYLGMDNQFWPFDDKLVRQAFNYGVNKENIINRVWNGRGLLARGVLPPGFPGADDTRPPVYPYNPEKAKQLLQQAGFKDSNGNQVLDKDGKDLAITLWFNQQDTWARTASAVQADLKQLGVKVDVRPMQWAPYVEKIRKYEAGFFRFGWQADYPDPDNFLWTLFSKENFGQDNSVRYSNPKVDDLLNKARVITDWSQREKLYREAENQIIDDAPWLFLFHGVEYKLVSPDVEGQQAHPIIQNVMKVVKWRPKSGG